MCHFSKAIKNKERKCQDNVLQYNYSFAGHMPKIKKIRANLKKYPKIQCKDEAITSVKSQSNLIVWKM